MLSDISAYLSPFIANGRQFIGALLGVFAIHLVFRVIVIPSLLKRGTDLHRNFIASRLGPKQVLSDADLPKEESNLFDDLTVRAVATVFALIVCPVAFYILFTCSPTLMSSIYERDFRTEKLFVWACAFFIWDLSVCLRDSYGALYVFHGAGALFVFGSGLHNGGFSHWMGTAVLLFEASTPLLHARKLYFGAIGWNPKRVKAQGGAKTDRVPEPPTGRALTLAFGLMFLFVRIIFGYPVSALYMYNMVRAIAAGNVHSVAVCSLVATLNAGFCVLNGFWMYQMLAGIVSQDESSEGNKGGGSAIARQRGMGLIGAKGSVSNGRQGQGQGQGQGQSNGSITSDGGLKSSQFPSLSKRRFRPPIGGASRYCKQLDQLLGAT